MRRAATFGELAVHASPLTTTLRFVRLSALALGVGCRSATPTTAAKAPEQASAVYEPSRALGTLFHDVQLSGVFPDSKTFVDARPLETPGQITMAYAT